MFSFKMPALPNKQHKAQALKTDLTKHTPTTTMDTKARPGAVASAVGLVHTDRQISSLFKNYLPTVRT
jgi:hypothetical protein